MKASTSEWLSRAADDLKAAEVLIVQPDLTNIMLDRLEAVYVEARYPGDLGLLPYGKPDKDDVVKFYDFAAWVVATIRIGLERQPAPPPAEEGEIDADPTATT